MTRAISDISILQDYLRGVVDRAEHHAPNVNEVALVVAGAIVWRKDAAPLRVLERDGEMKNVLWVEISDRRYALSYNHTTDAIDVREGTIRGPVLRSFNNATPPREVKSFFADL